MTPKLREAAKQAMEWIMATGEHDQLCGVLDLDDEGRHKSCTCGLEKTLATLRAALADAHENEAWDAYDRATAEPQEEPVAWMGAHDKTDLYYRKPPQADVVPLYTSPPARHGEWDRLLELKAEVEREKESRQAAQIENEELKARIARSGLELQRAVLAEREACAQICDERAMKNEIACADADQEDATSLRSAAWQMSICAAAIRARSKPEGEQT